MLFITIFHAMAISRRDGPQVPVMALEGTPNFTAALPALERTRTDRNLCRSQWMYLCEWQLNVIAVVAGNVAEPGGLVSTNSLPQ